MMKKNRLIFYSIFGVLHLFIFLSTLYMDYVAKHDAGQLFKLYSNIWMLKYCSFILLILFATNVILHFRDNKRNVKEKEELTQELNMLKAKMYDLQEKAKSQPAPSKPTE